MNEITEEFKTPLTTGICHGVSQLWNSGSAWSIISMTVCPYQTPSSTDDTLTDDIPNSPVDPTPTEIDKLVIQTMYMYSIASLNRHSL